MNILGFVFSLILILSYIFFACWEKQNGSARLRVTYLSHENVHRKILRDYEKELYQSLRSKPNPLSVSKDSESKEEKNSIPEPLFNQECAKLNLWPLLQEGREDHPFLYEMAAKLLRTFYQPLFGEKVRFEYPFLDKFLQAARIAQQKETLFQMEKIAFSDPSFQYLYYKMLKGTQGGYPSLLDYLKFDPAQEKICLYHAHPNLLSLLFNPKAAQKLYAELHKENSPPIAKERIETLCSESHLFALDPALFSLIELGRPIHKASEKITFIEEDPQTHLTLRKSLPRSL